MEPVTAITSIGALVLNIIKETREIVRSRQKPAAGLVRVDSLVQLYDLANKLGRYAHELQALAEKPPERVTSKDRELVSAFLDSMSRLARALERVNLTVIKIYYPDAAGRLDYALDVDIDILAAIQHGFNKNYDLKQPDIKKAFDAVQKTAEARGLIGDFSTFLYATEGLIPHAGLKSGLITLESAMSEVAALIADILKNNWDFKELETLKP